MDKIRLYQKEVHVDPRDKSSKRFMMRWAIMPDKSICKWMDGPDGRHIYWSSKWENCWKWVKAGWVRVVDYGPATYAQCSFFLLGRQEIKTVGAL